MARRPNQTERQVNAALRKLEPEVANAFLAAIQAARRQVNFTALVDALDRGDLGAAIRLLTFPQATLFPLEEAVRSAYMSGGQMIATAAPSALIAFSGNTPRAVEWLQTMSSVRIQGIYQETLEATRVALVAGRDAGMGSRAIARTITGVRVGNQRVGGILGLTTQQAESIMSGRAKLASGDPRLMSQYLDLKLRDRRYDAQIKRAIADSKPITGAQLDRILDAHKSKALAYRGKLIASNETFKALEAGRYEAIQQAVDNPEVEGATKRWQWNFSRDPRPDHKDMNGEVVPYDQPFIFPDGVQMMHAHDESAPISHNANCGCITIYRVRMRT